MHTASIGSCVCQVPTRDIVEDIQGAEDDVADVKLVPGPVETTVNTIRYANIAMNHLDTTTYLQPFRTFNTVFTGIANVRSSTQYS